MMEHNQPSQQFSIGSSFYDNMYNVERRIILEETETETEAEYKYMEFTKKQLSAAMWITHITGIITFVCSLFVLGIAWKRRSHLFHRLAFGT